MAKSTESEQPGPTWTLTSTSLTRVSYPMLFKPYSQADTEECGVGRVVLIYQLLPWYKLRKKTNDVVITGYVGNVERILHLWHLNWLVYPIVKKCSSTISWSCIVLIITEDPIPSVTRPCRGPGKPTYKKACLRIGDSTLSPGVTKWDTSQSMSVH